MTQGRIKLDDTIRSLFAGIVFMFDGETGKAREYLRDLYVDFDEKIAPVFDEYLNELELRVVSRGGSMAASDPTLVEILRETPWIVGPQMVDGYIEAVLSGEAMGRSVIWQLGNDEESDKRLEYIKELTEKIISAEDTAKSETDNRKALVALGVFARNWFRLYCSVHSSASTDMEHSRLTEEGLARLEDRMNRIRVGDEFDRRNIHDALLNSGVFSIELLECMDNLSACEAYSFFTADELEVFDAQLFRYYKDLSLKQKVKAGNKLNVVRMRVRSTAVDEVIYDKINGRLLIHLHKDRYQEYKSVPGYVVWGLVQAESCGRFFGAEICGSGFEYNNINRTRYDKVREQSLEDCYLKWNVDIDAVFDSVLRRTAYDFKACRNGLRLIYGHVFDCALYTLEAKLMYAEIRVPMAKVLRWQTLEMKEMQKELNRLDRKINDLKANQTQQVGGRMLGEKERQVVLPLHRSSLE